MKRISPGIATIAIAAALLPASRSGAGEVSPGLSGRLAALGPGQSVPVIVTLAQSVDPAALRARTGSVPGMIRALRDSAAHRVDRIRRRAGAGWPATAPKVFWINQTFAMPATPGLIERLRRDPDVAMIREDEALYVAAPFQSSPVGADDPGPFPGAAPGTIPWNLVITGVDSVWDAYGLDGSGVIVGSLDTGIDPSHPALAGKLRAWDGWQDIIFGQPAPYDNLGHGTFGAGILAGADGGQSSLPGIGIAHGSRLVVVKILDAGASTISQVTSGMQWILDPDGDPNSSDYPRVINNSWFSGTRGSTYAYAAAAAWRAAGIVPVFCAGNSGPSAGTTRSPGDYKNCLSVGGTDAADDRYDNTSVGPAPADTNYFPADGRKPDLSAPGEGVYSSESGGGYGTSSGTSWSAPHVTGIVALMLQANPALDHDRVFSILRGSSADLGAGGYDHVFGYGRVSAMGAVTGALRSRIRVQADTLLRTTEQGANAWFDVWLDVMPGDSVRISFASSDATEGAVEPASVVFTAADWAVPKRVSVAGVDDASGDGDVEFAVTMVTASADPLYDGIEPPPLPAVNGDDEDAVVVQVKAGWNLVSVPAAFDSSVLSTVFPSAVGPAYRYDSGYAAVDSLRRGVGYWLRFAASGTLPLLGDSTAAETVAVRSGWNLVGSLSGPVDPAGIVADPPGIVASRFYEFDAGYRAADVIVPGRGYWVKVSGEGTLLLTAGPPRTE